MALLTGVGGGVGGIIGRYFATHGKSRASDKVDDLQKKLDDLQDLVDHFQEGMVNPGPPTIREAA